MDVYISRSSMTVQDIPKIRHSCFCLQASIVVKTSHSEECKLQWLRKNKCAIEEIGYLQGRLIRAKRRCAIVRSELDEMRSRNELRLGRRKRRRDDVENEDVGESEPRSIEWEVEVRVRSG